MTTVVVIDTETDCLEGEEGEARVIELAAVRVVDGKVDITEGLRPDAIVRSWTFAPGPKGISPRACAIHHITDEMLAGCHPFDTDAWRLALGGADYVVAHNIAFDSTVVDRALNGEAPRPVWLCTLKLARAAWPEAPSHGNQAIRYWLRLNVMTPPNLYPHRAGYDAVVTAHLFAKLFTVFEGDLGKMEKISTEPSLLSRVNFGKHKGLSWSAVPKDYLTWLLRQPDLNEDTRHTAKHWIERQ